jgi:hypothetical protein
MIGKILKWLFEIQPCVHGVDPKEQHCPLCYGYIKGAISPTSAPYTGTERPKPSPMKK